MSSLAIACTLFGWVLVSTLAAMMIASRLPGHHIGGDFKDIVRLGLGIIGTLTAMVLGLLVASAKGTYDAQSGTVKEISAQLAVIDRVLARYGAEAAGARERLHELAQATLDQMWPQDAKAAVEFSGGASRNAGEALFEEIAKFEPANDTQRMLKSRAQDMLVGLAHPRQRLLVNSERSIPSQLLVVLGIWQAVLFAGIGLLAPRNAAGIAVLMVCMLSVSSSIFLIMELDRPFAGMIRVSEAPLRSVISHLGE